MLYAFPADITDESDPYLEYVLTKNEIDYAHKDKQNKLYPPDFKVRESKSDLPQGQYNSDVVRRLC